jgi:[ribosomal protein S5]-alanine N-acetyltransferase
VIFKALPAMEHDVVFLRELVSGDIQPWYDYLCLPQVYEHTSWDVRAPADLAHYAWKPEEFTEASLLPFGVASKSTNRLVGTAGFHSVSPQNQTAEIAYDLAPDVWGRGIATAVCRELVCWAHASADIIRVQASVLESNARSTRVLERCGFVREGLLRSYRMVRGRPGNFFMYSHLADDRKVIPPAA